MFIIEIRNRQPRPGHRPLNVIAQEVREDWQRVYFGAVPYLEAMGKLRGMDDTYGEDDADSVVRYFLANAQTWRGERARAIKKELKSMLDY